MATFLSRLLLPRWVQNLHPALQIYTMKVGRRGFYIPVGTPTVRMSFCINVILMTT